MRRRIEQELFRTREVSNLTGLSIKVIREAIHKNELYAWRKRPQGGRPAIYFIPRYAIYAWLGHRGSEELMKHAKWEDHRKLLMAADIHRETKRLRELESHGPFAWDQNSNPLRQWRLHLGLSISALARQIGINSRSIAGFERGEYRPAPRSIDRYSQLMSVPGDEIQAMLDKWHADHRMAGVRTQFETGVVIGPDIPTTAKIPEILRRMAEYERSHKAET